MGEPYYSCANGVSAAPTGVWRFFTFGLLLVVFASTYSVANAGAYDDILIATANGHVGDVSDLISRGMDVNTTDQDGSTLLLIAARGDFPVLVKFLLQNRAGVNKRNRYGDTALHVAASQGNLASASLLIEAGAELNPSGWTPLHYAAYAGHVDLVELLISKGAQVDSRAPNGRTALMLAAQNDHVEVSTALRRAGADIQITDYDGKTAEEILAEVGKSEKKVHLNSH